MFDTRETRRLRAYSTRGSRALCVRLRPAGAFTWVSPGVLSEAVQSGEGRQTSADKDDSAVRGGDHEDNHDRRAARDALLF
jgi:hypothetical protein